MESEPTLSPMDEFMNDLEEYFDAYDRMKARLTSVLVGIASVVFLWRVIF